MTWTLKSNISAPSPPGRARWSGHGGRSAWSSRCSGPPSPIRAG